MCSFFYPKNNFIIMINEERKTFIRKEATNVLELTKGYNPEQRLHLGNLLTTVEDLADYILELTSDCEQKI